MSDLQPHIKLKTGDIAPYVLIPGDPDRVRKIATYLEDVKEVMLNREYLTINGTYKGVKVSAMSTGMGCPSAAIGVEELANIGAKVLIRIGTCGALKKGIEAGDLIIPYKALRQDGTTDEYLPPNIPSLPDKEIFDKLVASTKSKKYTYFCGVNRTHDAFYEPTENFLKLMQLAEYKEGRLISSEMECSAVFTVANLRKIKAGSILAVFTPEPLEDVAKNPDLVYQLDTQKEATEGVGRSIEVALDVMVEMDKLNK